MSIEHKEELMIQTMRRFLDQRKHDAEARRNGKLPPKQERFMQSILKQAGAISTLRDQEAMDEAREWLHK